MQPAAALDTAPLRATIESVYRTAQGTTGTTVCARVLQGSIEQQDNVVVVPHGIAGTATVKRESMHCLLRIPLTCI